MLPFPFAPQFGRHIGQCYRNLSEMTALELKPELRLIMRDVFYRIGSQYYIMSQQRTPRHSTDNLAEII